MKFTALLICFALLPLFSRAQLTIEGVKSNIAFDGVIGQSLRGLCDAWYGKALQDGMTQEQAATLALDSLGSTLLRMADWKMNDSAETIRIDGGGGREYVPEIIGPFSGKTTSNSYAIGQSALDCITCISIDTTKNDTNSYDKSVKFGDFQSTLIAPEYSNYLSIGRTHYMPPAQKKDTIEVDVLCKFPKATNVLYSTMGANYSNTYITQMQQERTLEYSWVGVYTPNPATNGIAGSRQWVVRQTRWLHDMEGCFHLIKITD